MAENTTLNYPDVLGYITGGDRINMGVLQVAPTVRPRVIHAGRPFEVIVLMQNASDSDVDVIVAFDLPEKDANGQTERFITNHHRIEVGLHPAEVGYVTLPATCLPDTAVSDRYKVSLQMSVKTLKKPTRVRDAEGGDPPDFTFIGPQRRELIATLRKLKFAYHVKRGLRSSTLEVPFSVMGGKLGKIPDLHPNWVRLWTLKDYKDDRILLEQNKDLLRNELLPALNHETAYRSLMIVTDTNFSAAQYPLKRIEASFIAKMMAFVISLSIPTSDDADVLVEKDVNLHVLLEKGMSPGTVLPRWFTRLLREITQNNRIAKQPAEGIAHLAYEELLQDSVERSFKMIATVTGESLGTEEEARQYGQQLANRLSNKEPLSLIDVYMPLILGGIIIADRLLLPGENINVLLDGISDALQARRNEQTADNELVFTLADTLIDRARFKYGYRQ
ncbi:MAG: hypothetical protein D6737_19515 [Chloroflexi bacterium]|nr:MAG: hypothetical protein D6737_19515 [Chloroflexota bacterium]